MNKRAVMFVAGLLWSVTSHNTTAHADSFLGVSVPGHPGAIHTLVELFESPNPFDHYSILTDSDREAERRARFLLLHLSTDPQNPLRELDAGIAESMVVRKSRSRHRVPSARAHLLRATSMTNDARLYLVVGIALAQLESIEHGRGGWARATAGKKKIVTVLERACELNRSQGRKLFGATWLHLRSYMIHYAGYDAFTKKSYHCLPPTAP